MVCRWMSQGTLADYLGKDKNNLSLQGRLNIVTLICSLEKYVKLTKIFIPVHSYRTWALIS
jgi:hypothetical protein